jgi:signal transduction histidine kinase
MPRQKKEQLPFTPPGISQLEALSTQLLSANLELERVNRELRASEEERALMLEHISHDLRAPLTVIRGVVDRVLLGVYDENNHRALMLTLDERLKALEQLVGELYFSVAIGQPGALNMQLLPVAPFLEEFFISQEIGGRFTGRKAILNIADGFDSALLFDPANMARVFDNLLSNALKFTAEGDIIEIGCRSRDAVIELYLRDSGAGIAPEHLPHIFERTYKADRARTPENDTGSGLGLYIAKTIVEKHGGEILCESEPGKGSVFTVRIG